MPVRVIESIRGIPYPELVDFFSEEVKRNPAAFHSRREIEGLIQQKFHSKATKIASEYVYEDLVLGIEPNISVYNQGIRKSVQGIANQYNTTIKEYEVKAEEITKELRVTTDNEGKTHHFIITKYSISGKWRTVKKID